MYMNTSTPDDINLWHMVDKESCVPCLLCRMQRVHLKLCTNTGNVYKFLFLSEFAMMMFPLFMIGCVGLISFSQGYGELNQ